MTDDADVFVIDDDESVRDAVTNLLEAVNLRARAFASTEEFSRSDARTPLPALYLTFSSQGRQVCNSSSRWAERGS